jgi:hypothetical protein
VGWVEAGLHCSRRSSLGLFDCMKPVSHICGKEEGLPREMLGAIAVMCSRERAGPRNDDT